MRYKVVWTKHTVLYSVYTNVNESGVLLEKPKIIKKIAKEEDVSAFVHEVPDNATCVLIEGNEHMIVKKVHDVAEGIMILHSAWLEVVEEDKSYCEEWLKEALKEWNEQEIKKSPRMMAWCRLNGKNPRDVDVDDLRLVLNEPKSNSIAIDASSGTYMWTTPSLGVGVKSIESGNRIAF